jgi:biofilm PGA synthesis N-glycosyltransferase PgaC
MSPQRSIAVDVGICIHNGGENITGLLDAIMSQRMKSYFINRVIIVSSGSTDGTNKIIESFASRNSKIQLVREDRRQGKASAINRFLENSSTEIAILESGDTLPLPGCYEALLEPFRNSKVGMTGARPVPVNGHGNLMGNVVKLLWETHGQIAVKNPKLGELVAFRRLFRTIPTDTVADEAFIEYIVKSKNMELRFVPDAVVLNRGPEKLTDYIEQRRRVFIGHMQLKDRYGYQTSTMNPGLMISAVLEELSTNPLPTLFYALVAAGLETHARVSAFINYRLKHIVPYIWRTISSTSNTIPKSTVVPPFNDRQRTIHEEEEEEEGKQTSTCL